jgi:hypothetical protein
MMPPLGGGKGTKLWAPEGRDSNDQFTETDLDKKSTESIRTAEHVVDILEVLPIHACGWVLPRTAKDMEPPGLVGKKQASSIDANRIAHDSFTGTVNDDISDPSWIRVKDDAVN